MPSGAKRAGGRLARRTRCTTNNGVVSIVWNFIVYCTPRKPSANEFGHDGVVLLVDETAAEIADDAVALEEPRRHLGRVVVAGETLDLGERVRENREGETFG